MSERKHATVFHDPDNIRALTVSEHETIWSPGISERNIGEWVETLTKLGYQVSLYTISNPKFFAPAEKKEEHGS